MTADAEVKERTYGGWRRPQSPGVGPLKLMPTIIMMTGLGATLLVSMAAGIWVAIGFATGALLLVTPAVIPLHGRNAYSEWSKSLRWRRHEHLGRNIYRSGLAGVTPAGTRSLPGLLAKVKLWEATDAIGRDFGLVEITAARQWAVVMRVASQGGALVDSDTNDVWVARWGEYLALLGQEGGVVQAAAVVETLPDAGATLKSHVSAMLSRNAPVFARDVMFASAAELPAGVAETLGYVALTFSERGLGIDRKDGRPAAAVAEEIGRRLPGLSVGLRDAGASEGVPLSTHQLARRVREAFDPGVALEFAEQAAIGAPIDVVWEDAGPSAHDESMSSYRHDTDCPERGRR